MNVVVNSNPVFKSVHRSKHRYVIMKGSAGSGKSVDTAQQYVLRILTEKGRNLLCVRKAEVTNRDSTFAELVKAINKMGLSRYFNATSNPLRIRCVNGNSILFRVMNSEKEMEKLKSITVEHGTITDIWCEEGTELTKQNFEILDDRLRGVLPDGLFYQMKITFNPVNKEHWIKKAFFDHQDPDVLTHHSTYLDNRFIDDAYHRRMMRRKELDPEGYRIYGLGEWGELKGLILNNWEVREVSHNYEDYDDIALGQDFGFNHANAILVLGIKDDQLTVIDEIYEFEKESNELIELAKGKNIPKNRDMWCDSAEPDRIKMWRKAGYIAKPVSKEQNSIKAQIDWLKGRKLSVDPHCVNTIKELQQWKWKYDDVRDVQLDVPIDFFDDAMAALRYGIEGWRKQKKAIIMSKYEMYD